MLFSTGNWSVGLQQIIQQYYDAYGQNPETYFPPDPKIEQEHLRPVQDPPSYNDDQENQHTSGHSCIPFTLRLYLFLSSHSLRAIISPQNNPVVLEGIQHS